MRKLMMVAAAAAIALVGLSANTCGGEQKPAEQPATQPEAQPTQPETQPETQPAQPPAQ
ncbi:MAG: hypothetical protein ACXWVI_02100 [Methyloceanibacter sp.]